ncbi:uncharacterized protein LOC129597365 [Paramacrobiotus metropolitanus]|uniref:uncharacterized protein LOC129597365 n=1 Tax=Paramacrobiotus metropolitanus TaxID=2943436 RepID=UPI0024459415|nr:uncharacterized protein LOC129597365 [Paramacrobiotus metropolitanus]
MAKKKRSKLSSVTYQHLNIQGFSDSKFDLIENLLESDDNCSKIFCISETHLNSAKPDDLYRIRNYALYRKDRSKAWGKAKGGGLLVYVPSHIPSEEVSRSETNTHCETLWLKLRFGIRKVLLGLLYRSPDSNAFDTEFLFNHVDEVLTKHSDCDFVISGDINIDISNAFSPYYRHIHRLMDNFDLVDKVVGPTRVAHRSTKSGLVSCSATKIDIMLCSPASDYSACPAEDVYYSDHRLCFAKANYKAAVPTHETVCFRLWSHTPEEKFLQLVSQVAEKYAVIDSEDVSSVIGSFVADLTQVVDECFPKRSRRVRRTEPPWMNSEVKTLIKNKDDAYRRKCQSRGTP